MRGLLYVVDEERLGLQEETTGVDWSRGDDAFPSEADNLTGDRRTEARLCAVQFLFGHLTTPAAEPLPDNDAARAQLVADFAQARAKQTGADKKLFSMIATEALRDQARYAAMISAQLLEGWRLDRIDPVQHALLWAAAAELTANTAVGPKVVLNEFLNIAKGFAPPAEVAFINATLDRLARMIRQSEGQPDEKSAG